MKKRMIPDTYPLFDTVYGTEVPIDQFYIIKFDWLPSKHHAVNTYDPKIVDYIKELGFTSVQKIYNTNRRYDFSRQYLWANDDKKIMIRTYGSVDDKKDNLVTLEIAYDLREGTLDTQLDMEAIAKFEKKKKRASINLVKSEMGHLDTEEYDLFVPPLDLEANYGKEFIKIHQVIEKRLNQNNDKGIIMLHGLPGSGKTTYIKHLTSLIKEKEILFIPPSMAEMLSEPTIIPFLMEHKNSILIIEDSERVIGDRELNGSPAGVSNILNLTDGILGDCLNIQIIATFNMKREKIDKALLRKGRLIAEHKFDKLSIEETNKLLKKLGKDDIALEPMCLADIYNIDVELYKTEDKTSKIGF